MKYSDGFQRKCWLLSKQNENWLQLCFSFRRKLFHFGTAHSRLNGKRSEVLIIKLNLFLNSLMSPEGRFCSNWDNLNFAYEFFSPPWDREGMRTLFAATKTLSVSSRQKGQQINRIFALQLNSASCKTLWLRHLFGFVTWQGNPGWPRVEQTEKKSSCEIFRDARTSV